MKPAIIPATFAWAVGSCFVLVAVLYSEISASHLRGDGYALAGSIPDSLFTFVFYLLIYSIGTAVVVFPTCLLVVVPLLRLLPRSSPLWHPNCAAVIGAITGPLAMYVWSAILRFEFYIPSAHDINQVWGGVAALLVGATFGYLYAKSVRTARA